MPTGTYEDLEYSDEEEDPKHDEQPDEETKEARDGMRNAMKVPRAKTKPNASTPTII